MATLLHHPADLDAPVACDMSTAPDTLGERLRAYAAVFDRALARRERTGHAVVLGFAGDAATRAQVTELARREALCCPFVGHHVAIEGDEVVWTITNPAAGGRRAEIDAVLDAFHALPERAIAAA